MARQDLKHLVPSYDLPFIAQDEIFKYNSQFKPVLLDDPLPCISCPNNKPGQINVCGCTLPYYYNNITC